MRQIVFWISDDISETIWNGMENSFLNLILIGDKCLVSLEDPGIFKMADLEMGTEM